MPGRGPARSGRLAILLLLFAVGLVYWPCLKVPFFFDDWDFIVGNPLLRHLSGWSDFFLHPFRRNPDPTVYRPLTYLTFALNYLWGGLHPLGYRLFNIALHAGCVLLIYFCSIRLFKKLDLPDSDRSLLALAPALIFAVHPMNVDVVAFATYRWDSLATLLYLSAFLSFLNFREGNRKPFAALALLSMALSLCAKELALTLPLVLLAWDWIFECGRDWERLRARLRSHLPFWILLALYAFFRVLYSTRLPRALYCQWTPISYSLIQPYVVLRYLRMLFIPLGQSIDHFIASSQRLPDPRTLISLPVWAAAGFLFWRTARKDPAISNLFYFSALWFFIALIPSSSFMPINDAMTERRVYLPGWGFFLFWTGLLHLWLGKRKSPGTGEAAPARGRSFGIAVALQAAIFGGLTWTRATHFQNPGRMFEESITLYPENDRAYSNLGKVWADRGRLDLALGNFQRALALSESRSPAKPDTLDGYYRHNLHNNIGLIFLIRREFREALRHFRAAAKEYPPGANSYFNLGVTYSEMGDVPQAEEFYETALAAEPAMDLASMNLAQIYLSRGREREAVALLERAAKANPESTSAYFNLGLLYFQKGDLARAEPLFERSLRIGAKPDKSHNNLGLIHYSQNRFDRAVAEFNAAIQANPAFDLAYANLGAAYFQAGDLARAEPLLRRALELNPEAIKPRALLAALCEKEGRQPEALQEYESLLRRLPNDREVRAKVQSLRKKTQ